MGWHMGLKPPTLIGSSELGRGGAAAGNRTTALSGSFIAAPGQSSNHVMGTFMIWYNIPSIAIDIFEPEIKTFSIIGY